MEGCSVLSRMLPLSAMRKDSRLLERGSWRAMATKCKRLKETVGVKDEGQSRKNGAQSRWDGWVGMQHY